VAVRSSGVAEDSSESSYAGQFESFLNVNGRSELLEAVRKCWSSLFTARALSYKKARGLEHGVGLMGVAVQEMIYARSAGVCFTLHPLTKDSSNIIIEGNWGLGESVVQGLVTPDTYVIDKVSLKLIEKRVSKKEKGLALSSSGTTVIEIPSHKQKRQCLKDEEATKIGGFARSVELHYDAPQDIEWAVSDERALPDNIFLLQTRPIVSANSGHPVDQIIDGLLKTRGL